MGRDSEEGYDVALTKVMNSINDGALLEMGGETWRAVWKYYEPFFEREWKEEDPWRTWRVHEKRVLRLAELVGKLATFNTWLHWAQMRRISRYLDTKATLKACLWVSKIECGVKPAEDEEVGILGCYCTNCHERDEEVELDHLGQLIGMDDGQMEELMEGLHVIAQSGDQRK